MNWYTGNTVYDTVLFLGFIFVLLIIIGAKLTQSPYGIFGSKKMGINLHPKAGWILMELPATLVFIFFFIRGTRSGELVPILFCVIWLIHYANRGFIFPLLMRVAKSELKSFSIIVAASGLLVTTMHGYLNATFFTDYGKHLTSEWLTDPRFIIGIVIYYSGFILTVHSESIIRNLRDKKEIDAGKTEFKIPYGGGFRFVSSPMYLGEMTAWAGFAIFTWSLAGVLIFSITAANLIPRTFAMHKWYKEKFENYPQERKALIPFLL